MIWIIDNKINVNALLNEEICFHSKNRNKKEIFQENTKNAHGNIYQIKDFIENAMNLELTISRTI